MSKVPSSSDSSSPSQIKSCFPHIFFFIILCFQKLSLNSKSLPLAGLMGLCSLLATRGEHEPHAERAVICSRFWLVTLKLPRRLEATCCCQQHPSREAFPRFWGFPRVRRSNQLLSFFFCKNSALSKFVSCQPVHSCCLPAPSKPKCKGYCWHPQPHTASPEKWGFMILPGLPSHLVLPSVFSLQLCAGTLGSTLTGHTF